MTNFDIKFSQLICFSQLNLQVGDSLSINTEESTYSFALNLAKFAATITNLPVNIVVTEEGKVSQTVPVDPDILEIQRPKEQLQVMCRILDLNSFFNKKNNDPEKIIKSVVEISKHGILSEPIDLKRRIAVPWTVVVYPTKEFVEKTFSKLNKNEVKAFFAKLLRLDSENMVQYWLNQSNLLDYRIQSLNSLHASSISINNNNSKFEGHIVKNSLWKSNFVKLNNNRSFYNFLPAQSVHNNIQSNSSFAHLKASRDFFLFGQLVENASFNIKDGKVVSFKATKGEDALSSYFKSDETANVVSGISLCDEDTVESKYLRKNAHPLYSLENTTSIILGGAMPDSLSSLSEDVDLESFKINQSLVKLAIPIGDTNTSIKVGATEIYKEGEFLI